MRKSKILNNYSSFIERVRINQKKGVSLYKAISEAIKWAIENGILADFLKLHGSEVQNMLMTEFNIDIAREVWQEEAHEEGRQEGRQEGQLEERFVIAKNMLADGEPVDRIARYTGLNYVEIERLRDVD